MGIESHVSQSVSQSAIQSKLLLAGAITANLTLLGYFQYANFFAENLNRLTGTSLPIGQAILPLGISFFTFTQIAIRVDTYHGKVEEFNFVRYILFVSYFPHLIAGPIVHHKEMMLQFATRNVCHLNRDNVAVGLIIFVLARIGNLIPNPLIMTRPGPRLSSTTLC